MSWKWLLSGPLSPNSSIFLTASVRSLKFAPTRPAPNAIKCQSNPPFAYFAANSFAPKASVVPTTEKANARLTASDAQAISGYSSLLKRTASYYYTIRAVP